MHSLKAVGLTRRFGSRTAVDSLSFEVYQAEIVGFLGPNGAGKSTTFHMLSGLLAPHEGHLVLDDQELLPGDFKLRVRMGVLFQHPSLDLKLTGLENLEMGAALYALDRKSARERIQKGLELAQLSDRARDRVETYSGGMRRRLELTRVLLHEPEIVFMDEPTQGLDITAKQRIWQQLNQLRAQQKTTIVLTTHSPEEAEYCDRILILNQGKKIADGTPNELRALIGGDVVFLETEHTEQMAEQIHQKFLLQTRIVDNKVVFEHPSAHELIPRLVEAFPVGQFRSLNVRKPSLSDVFIKRTGQTFESADETETSLKK